MDLNFQMGGMVIAIGWRVGSFSLYPPNARLLSEKSSVSKMKISLVIRSGHEIWNRSWSSGRWQFCSRAHS